MRKVIVLAFVSLDGVIQSPGRPEEDTSGGFAYGGWTAPYSDDVLGTVINRQMNMPFDLLVGRKTFEIWAPYLAATCGRMAGRQCSDQVRRLEYHDFERLAALRVFRRRHCGKSHQNQATARAGFARLRKWKSRSDAHEA